VFPCTRLALTARRVHTWEYRTDWRCLSSMSRRGITPRRPHVGQIEEILRRIWDRLAGAIPGREDPEPAIAWVPVRTPPSRR
jgi:hypothetical protein